MSKVVAPRRARMVIVIPFPVTVDDIDSGLSVHNHNGYPTTAMFHSFTLGSGPTNGTGNGNSIRDTNDRTVRSTRSRDGTPPAATSASPGSSSGMIRHSFRSTGPSQHSSIVNAGLLRHGVNRTNFPFTTANSGSGSETA